MATATPRKVLVVAGLGKGAGTGGSTARVFAKAGYAVALIARGNDTVDALAKEITSAGGEAAGFPVKAYSYTELARVWKDIRAKYTAPNYRIDTAVYNAGYGVWKPFLDITEEEVRLSFEVVEGAFAFSHGALASFKENDVSKDIGKRGTLITTGATAAIRGNTVTSAFSAHKHGLRALSQSLNKEFGKQNIHVAHAIIDGGILTERFEQRRPDDVNNEDVRLNPDSIANSYIYLVNQDRSAWTWELDLRPAHEKW